MTARHRRAVIVIAASLIATLIACVGYLYAASSASTAGETSTKVPMLGSKYAIDFDFISPSEGWGLVTETRSDSNQLLLFHTVDGASHWLKQVTLTMPFGSATLRFFDRKRGMISILSSPSQLYSTMDGGSHWTALSLPLNVVAFAFADPLHGWLQTWLGAPGFGFRLFSTPDGGSTWSERNWPAAAVWGGQGRYGGEIEFRGGGEGWVGAYKSRASVYVTHDDGVSWKRILIPLPSDAFPDPPGFSRPAYPTYTTEVALLPGTGVLAFVTDYFGDTRAFASFDSGSSWRMLVLPGPGLQYSDYTFQDATHWWAMHGTVLYKTADAGRSWAIVRSPAVNNHWTYQPHVIDARHAWAVMRSQGIDGFGTALAMTSDGGITWPAASVPRLG